MPIWLMFPTNTHQLIFIKERKVKDIFVFHYFIVHQFLYMGESTKYGKLKKIHSELLSFKQYS